MLIVDCYSMHQSLYNTKHVMTHKCRGSIVVLSISKSVETNEEQEVLTSSFSKILLQALKEKCFWSFDIKNK